MSSTVRKSSKRKSRNGGSLAEVPKIPNQNDIIDTFFHQMLEYIVEDYHSMESILDWCPCDEVETIKDLNGEDHANSEVASVDGSNVTLKRKRSKRSVDATLTEKRSLASFATKNSRGSSAVVPSAKTSQLEEVRIAFANGNVYEGEAFNKVMNGKGTYYWADGTIYEGEFKSGCLTGAGKMTLPDLSEYDGYFCDGLFHGDGTLNIVATPKFYKGQWNHGKKQGEGWLFYGPNDWYEGNWFGDFRHGFGLRHYQNGSKYKGNWNEGARSGTGAMSWKNNDYYKGGWDHGVFSGYGEYVWKGFTNDTFSFPQQNIYLGSWVDGMRHGEGLLHYRLETGGKLVGKWDQNAKHGPVTLFCGNGHVVNGVFQFDKLLPLNPTSGNIFNLLDPHSLFVSPQYVEITHYLDGILSKIDGISDESLVKLRKYEEKHLRNVIIANMTKLNRLYVTYASCGSEEKLKFQPVMVRMFLWQFYKDIAVWKCGISLVETDKILANNPNSCLNSFHYPFEPIYFWQFLMSLLGVALATRSLDELEKTAQKGVLASVFKSFLQENVFERQSGSPSFKYKDLVPIKAVYSLYQELGEPLSAKNFLRHTCLKKKQDLPCHFEILSLHSKPVIGRNIVQLMNGVVFLPEPSPPPVAPSVADPSSWMHLLDIRHLGIKSVLRCLSTSCPLISSEGLIVDMDYKLTFLEFYDVLLSCIFLKLERDLIREKSKLQKQIFKPSNEPVIKPSVLVPKKRK